MVVRKAPQPGQAEPSGWLTLKDASLLLGVHFTTLRAWSDRGEVPVYRTPGGHRRFALDDLRRFLAQRAGPPPVHDDATLVDAAVGRVRQEIQQTSNHPGSWRYALDADAEQVRRQRGRQLFALALAYVLKPQQRERLLAIGCDLGRQYGWEAAESRVSLAETGRAVQFFRSQLVDVVRAHEAEMGSDGDDARIARLIDRFLDEVLFAVLDGYDGCLNARIGA
jgi:excisionase family DNA binding protein